MAKALTGHHFDLLCFDASNMGHFEALFEFRNLADFLVAGEALMPDGGYPYDAILSEWDALFPLTPRAVGELIVDQCVKHYGGDEIGMSHAVVETDQMDMLTMRLAELAQTVTVHPWVESEHLKQAIAASFEPLQSEGARDLSGFLGEYAARTVDSTVQDRLASASDAWQQVVSYSRECNLPEATGIGLYLPSSQYFGADLRDEYRPLAFNTATQWLEMLEATGVPSSSSSDIAYNTWEPGWRLTAAWTDAAMSVEPLLDAPNGGSGSPQAPGDLAGIVMFSEDSQISGIPEEWAQLEDGAPPGCYLLWLSYASAMGPPAMNVHVTLDEALGGLQHNLGWVTIENGSSVPFAVLTYVAGQFALGDWEPGDRVELSWSDEQAEYDIEIRDPNLTQGSPLDPDPLDGVIMFSQDSQAAGVTFEWARLHALAPCGGFLVLVTYKDYDGTPPKSAASTLRLYDIEGTLKQELGELVLGGGEYPSSHQAALLMYFE